MRLDLFLKTARLVKRRSQAKALCEANRVRVNGRPAKAGQQVRVGNRIAVDLYRREMVVEVQEIHPALKGRGRASARYKKVVAERRTIEAGDD
ncbi:MAG: S4 domain-containing protein [Candidatus Methylomirabilales bacterium]